MSQENIKVLDLYPDVVLNYIGPDINEGPLPALFYLALSAHETLGVDPYNQPAVYLSSLPLRIFTIDLPGHGKDLSSQEALKVWADAYRKGHPLISETGERIAELIADLIVKNIILREKCAIAGLSRGVLLAAHAAARCPDVLWILGFAPLTKVSFAREFQDIKDDPLVQGADMETLIPHLLDRKLRFYMGNCDQRTGTRHCFDFIEKLAWAMHEARNRSPSVELIISPSIGFQGHGTAKHTFHHGAQWLAEQLGAIDVR
jgi:pimeloyl-ACP methyl ester carboxylesterase